MSAPKALPGLTYRQYSALPGVSASQLRTLRQGSPLHLRHYLDTPDEDTRSRGTLRAIHCLVLEQPHDPEAWGRDFVVYQGGRRAGHAWEAWAASQMDRTILIPSEEAEARAIAGAVLAHPVAAPLLSGGGFSELSGTWTDETTGLDCRLRIDRLKRTAPTSWMVIDLKTIDSCSPHRIRSLVGANGWHIQLAHYAAGIRAMRPGDTVTAALITVEDSAPHDVAVWVMGPVEELVAEQERQALLATYAQCLASGRWPGRFEFEQELKLPTYCYPEVSMEDVDVE
jgi:hypothetical protein